MDEGKGAQAQGGFEVKAPAVFRSLVLSHSAMVVSFRSSLRHSTICILYTLGNFAPLCLQDYVTADAVTPTCLSGVLKIPGAPPL